MSLTLKLKGLGEACDNLSDAIRPWLDSLNDDSDSTLTIEDLLRGTTLVAWREETVDGRRTKIPYAASGRGKASTTNPATWGTQEQAARIARNIALPGSKAGVGIAFHDLPDLGLTLIGVDLDGCVSQTGDIAPHAIEVIDTFRSYAEFSPSGAGIKVFAAVRLEDKSGLVDLMGKTTSGTSRSRVAFVRGPHCEIALDRAPRYYAFTGMRIPGAVACINAVPLQTIEWLLGELGPRYLKHNAPQLGRRDESGSGHAYRMVLRLRRAGYAENEIIEALGEDGGPAGDWFSRSDERQRQRVLVNAERLLDRQAEDLDTVFDEYSDRPADNPVTRRLNELHAVVAVGGQTKVAHFRNGVINLGSDKDLHVLYANDLVPVDGSRTEPASKVWMRDPQRRTYRNGMVFLPGQDPPPGTLNLYTGLSATPNPEASCDRILMHLRDVICDGDDVSYSYLIGYLAHLVQRPFEKPGVALVLRGPKGAGKDTLVDYLACIIGQNYVRQVAHPDHVTGKFNAHLETAIVLNLQEGFWAGSHKQESTLKHLITSPQVEIERKGVDLAAKPSYFRVIITANADWVVPASSDERRYAVYSVSGARCGDKAYFDSLRGEMESEGPSALLHHLGAYDLSAFDVRRPPYTVGLLQQKIQSLRNIDRWWYELLWSPDLANFDQDWNTAFTIPREALRLKYESWMIGRRHDGETISPDQFGERLRKLVEVSDRRPRKGLDRPWCYVIPEVTSAREQFEKFLGGKIDWDK